MASLSRVWAIGTLLWCLWTLPAQAQPKDELVIGMLSFSSSMHPFADVNTDGNYLRGASRRDVARRDGNGQSMCQLCTEMPSLKNGRVREVRLPDGGKGMEVTFTLRPDLKWGDGTPLTTKDIVFGFEVARSFGGLAGVTEVVATDDLSYVVKTNSVRFDVDRLTPPPVNAVIEGSIFRAATGPQDYASKSIFTRAPETAGLWNGPYLVTEFEPSQRVVFAPNPYWDGEKPAFRQVTMRLIANSSALQANLLSGDIDASWGLGVAQALDLPKRYPGRFDISFVPTTRTAYLYCQLDNSNLADKRVRQAIALGVDRHTIVDRLFGGKWPIAVSVLAPVDPNFDQDLRPWPYDPARARALLEQAGYKPGPDGIMVRSDGTRLSLELLTIAELQEYTVLQQVIQSQLKQIGIEIMPKTESNKEIWSVTMPRRLFKGLVLGTWSTPPDSVPAREFSTSGIPNEKNKYSGYNYTSYSNPRIDDVLARLFTELDPDQRRETWRGIQTVLKDDLPQVPLYNRGFILQGPNWMSGLTPIRSIYVPTLWIEYWKSK